MNTIYATVFTCFVKAMENSRLTHWHRWYLRTAEGEEGPLTLEQLRRHPQLTPDAWVRRSDGTAWRRARDVPELRDLFADEAPLDDQNRGRTIIGNATLSEEIALTLAPEPSPWLIWLLFVLVILVYTAYQLGNR